MRLKAVAGEAISPATAGCESHIEGARGADTTLVRG